MRFQVSHPHRRALRGPAIYICAFILLSTSLLSKKDLDAPMMDFALAILVWISMSSFSSGVIRLPRYLNLFTKCIFLFPGSEMSSGSIFLSKSSRACFRLGGKYMASDLDFVVSDPKCKIRPNRAKCLSNSVIACRSSWRVSNTKKLSST